MEETNFGNTKMGEEGTGEDGPCAGAEIALQPIERPGEEGVFQQPVEASTQRQRKA